MLNLDQTGEKETLWPHFPQKTRTCTKHRPYVMSEFQLYSAIIPPFNNIHLRQNIYLRTENILAIFPIARILFLITSLRAAAALAADRDNP